MTTRPVPGPGLTQRIEGFTPAAPMPGDEDVDQAPQHESVTRRPRGGWDEPNAADKARIYVARSRTLGIPPDVRERDIARAQVWAAIAQAEALNRIADALRSSS